MLKRPNISDDIIKEAAKKLAAEIRIASRIDAEPIDIFSNYQYGMDGYQTAKALEDQAGWDIDTSLVDYLDCMESYVDDEYKEVCQKWFDDNNIQPPFEIGTKIKEGAITGIDRFGVANYLVKETGCTQKGRYLLIKFEDAALPRVN